MIGAARSASPTTSRCAYPDIAQRAAQPESGGNHKRNLGYTFHTCYRWNVWQPMGFTRQGLVLASLNWLL